MAISLVSSVTSSSMMLPTTTPPSPNSSSQLKHDIEIYRLQLSNQMAITLLPAIIIIGIIMIISCIGNLMVFYVYLKKFNPSSTRSAILALACFDLVASCFAMPGEIVDIRFSHNFGNEAMCKIVRLGTTVVLISSGFTLMVVAVDRYRRICHPMDNQMTPGRTQMWATGSFVVAMVFSIPAPIIYGLSNVQTPFEGVYGIECSIAQKYHGHILPRVYNYIQASLFLTVFSVIIVLYCLLGRQVLRQNKFRNSHRRTLSHEEKDHSITDGTKESQNEGGRSPVPDVIPEAPFHQSKDQDAEQKQSKFSPQRKMSAFSGSRRRSSTDDRRTRKTTLMLFIITAVFVISFLPHLILKGIQATKKDFPNSASRTEIVLYNIFVRSYFFNSVANCFIYGFCSPKFRRECKKIVLILFCCQKKK